MRKTILLLPLLLFVCKTHSQNADKEIDYLQTNNLIDLNQAPKYKKAEIKKEFNLLIESAKNNFTIDKSIDPSTAYRREAALLHSICFYKIKKYKDELLFLQKKHKELYEKEEKRRNDFLKANPGIRIKYRMNYDIIYKYIENYITPCIKGNKK